MAADRNTPEGVENWLIQSSTNPWSFPSIVGPELTREILQHICNRWSSYSSNIKLGVLFALLCIRKISLNTMGNELSAIITNGSSDNDEWVRLVSKMLQNYPTTNALDLNIEQHIPKDAQEGLQNLMERIQRTGIKFHPTEYAFIDRDISDAFSTLTIELEPARHFALKQGFEISKQQRLYALNNVAMPPPSPGLTSPVNVTGFNFVSDQTRIGSSQASTGPSIFIPKRRPSQLSQPFLRSPSLPKPGSINILRGPDSPTEPKITQGKKYVKPTKIQILDITTATTITRNQEETKLKTQMEEQQMKEMRRQEREKRQEERRREDEEKKNKKEREKAEKVRLKEEAKLAKEKEKQEKREKAAAKTAASNELSNTQQANVPYDETIEEEVVSDEDLPHKKSKKATVSPTFPASLSPANLYQPDMQTSSTHDHIADNTDTIATVSQNGSSTYTQATIAEPLSSASEQPIVADPELPRPQFEEIPKNEMNEELRRQFEMNCGAVLDKSNKIHGDNRQLIINFLGGHHTKPEQRDKLMNISKGVSNNEDEIRHIILHEEKTPIPDEGKEIQETFIFEMNLSNGQWRKLKRKKTKAVKNPNLEALNGRPNVTHSG
ncbi:2379_t:CDS:2 [Funneliformis mosseae]|uniref:2379_t:CDS:1 n=1 Tax=Funneliformis mosseae TaxID=27381 RepID=A0A9N8V8F5_FUNMO|nr:2379_t:CDS:2 [Funneliformis mosseae]